MRVFRTILGMVSLTVGLPTLLGGGGLWAVMQHRDPGGAFSAELQRLTVPGYAVVVPDIDRLLRADAPFARIGETQLRLSAATADGRAFLGLAPADQVARYLDGVPHTEIDAVDIGTGLLPVTTSRAGGRHAPTSTPAEQPFWTAAGPGQISLTPGELTDQPYSLVLMHPGGAPVLRLAVVAEVRPGWLNTGTWGLLTLGTLLVMAGVIVLVRPGRRREVVYVVEPSQVPELMRAIGAPLPLPGGAAYFAGTRHGGAHRPRTLADVRPRPPALPQFSWPPNAPATTAGPAAVADPAATAGPVTLSTATLSGTPDAAPGDHNDPPGSGYPPRRTATGTLTAPVVPLPATPTVGPGAAATTVAPAEAAAPAGSRTPAPGQPLSMLGDIAGSRIGQVPARRGERRPQPAADLPPFQATAVGAWVAATAPERARQTEARAAARLAEAAARRNAGKFAPSRPGARNMPADVRIPIAAPRRDNGELPTRAPARQTGNPPVARRGEPAPGPGENTPEEMTISAGGNTVPVTMETTGSGFVGAATADRDLGEPAGTADPEEADRPADDGSPNRFALHTGPAVTDWAATAISRIDSAPEPDRAVAPEEPRTDARPERARRSMHAVETDGPAALPERPAPVPTRVGPNPRVPVAPGSAASGPVAFGAGDPATSDPGKAEGAAPPPGEVAGTNPTATNPTATNPATTNPATTNPTATNPTAGRAAASDSAREGTDDDPAGGRNAEATAVPAAGPQLERSGSKERGRARKSTGTRAGDDLLARAQSRVGTKAAPVARPAPAARRAPAAWVKAAERAAESVAARAGRSAGEPTDTPPAGRAADGASATSGETGGVTAVAAAPPVEIGQTGGGAAVPQRAGNPPASGKSEGDRPLSYREEAAELLAAAAVGERRRRRTVAGQSRSKSDPAAGTSGTPSGRAAGESPV